MSESAVTHAVLPQCLLELHMCLLELHMSYRLSAPTDESMYVLRAHGSRGSSSQQPVAHLLKLLNSS
jgi:hypothetical protein